MKLDRIFAGMFREALEKARAEKGKSTVADAIEFCFGIATEALFYLLSTIYTKQLDKEQRRNEGRRLFLHLVTTLWWNYMDWEDRMLDKVVTKEDIE